MTRKQIARKIAQLEQDAIRYQKMSHVIYANGRRALDAERYELASSQQQDAALDSHIARTYLWRIIQLKSQLI